VSFKKHELIALHGRLGSPPVFGGIRVANFFLIFCSFCFSSSYVCEPNVAIFFSGLLILDRPNDEHNMYNKVMTVKQLLIGRSAVFPLKQLLIGRSAVFPLK
jgi:hypothetical protein